MLDGVGEELEASKVELGCRNHRLDRSSTEDSISEKLVVTRSETIRQVHLPGDLPRRLG